MAFVKIRRPEPGPVEPPPPEPVPYVTPRMSGLAGVQPLPSVRAVQESDVEPLLEAFGPILRERWPHALDERLRPWWRAAMSDRLTYFFRSRAVVGMFHVQQDVLEPRMRVVEKFVRRTKDATREEQAGFYRFIMTLARDSGALEMVFNLDSNCAMTQSAQGQGVREGLQSMKTNITTETTYTLTFDRNEE